MFNSVLTKNYKNFSKIFNQIWIVLIVLAIGIFIMQLISGNLKSNESKLVEDYLSFPCKQTRENDLEKLPQETLKTNLNQSIINNKKELIQTSLIKNSIPQITNPKFSNIEELKDCLFPLDEIIIVSINSEVKLYPKKILNQHLIINDTVGNTPILISYCALCDAIRVYNRNSFDEADPLVFGTTGLLYKNNDVIYDYQTETLWSQYTGQAIIGKQVGKYLKVLPFSIGVFQDIKEEYPNEKVLNFDTGFRRNYLDNSFEEFKNNEKIIAPIANINPKIPLKTSIIGFKVDDQNYALVVNNDMKEQIYNINSKELKVIPGKTETLVLYEDTPIEFTKSFWYVWFDFFPDTIILEKN